MRRKLGSVEHAFTASGRFAPMAAVSVLHLHPGPAPEKVRQALDTLQQTHPLLRATLLTKGGSFFFDLGHDAPFIPLNVIPRRDDAHWQEVATAELNLEIGQDGTTLLRLNYLRSADEDGPADLLFSFNHSIIDATSGVCLQEQLLALCAEPGAQPEARSLLPPVEERFPSAQQGLRKIPQTLAFLGRQMVDEMRCRWQARGTKPQPIYPTAICGIVPKTLDVETTTKLVRASRRHRTTLNSLLSAALLSAVHKHLYDAKPMPLRAIMFGNLRPYLDPPIPPQDLGCMITMLRYTVPFKAGMDIWQVAAILQEENNAAFKRGEKFLASLFSKQIIQMTIQFKAFRLATTAVSYAGPLDLQACYGPYKVTGLDNFVSNNRLGPELVSAAHMLFGQLVWDFLYLDTDMTAETAETITTEAMNLLRLAAGEQ